MTASIESIAAKVDEIGRSMRASEDKRLSAFEGLLSSIESSLADLVENVEQGGGAAAIEAMASALKSISMPEVTVNVNPTPVTVQVPEQKAPTVNVQVNPTPVTVEAIMPTAPAPIIHLLKEESKKATWEIRTPGLYGGADRVMTITRTS